MRAAYIMMTLSILVGMLCGCAAQPNLSPAGALSAATAESSSLPPDQSSEGWELSANGENTAEALNEILVELNYKVGKGFDRNIFNQRYVFENFERVAIYRTWKWTGIHLNESVVLLYLKDEKRFQPMELGVYQCLPISSVRMTQNPDVLSVDFEDAVFTFGSEYYTRSFIGYLHYSISQNQVVDRFYLPKGGVYGMVGSSISYAQQFQGCEVIDGRKAALRFEVLETNGYAGFPQCTEIVLPQTFEAGLPGEILLPHVKLNLSPELLGDMSAMEGFRSVAAEPMQTGANHGTRLIVTPKPGYTVSCGFDSEEVAGWESTLYLFAEKTE